jgi:hypothetical protein
MGVAAIYNRASFRQAKREALATWHGLLEGIVGIVGTVESAVEKAA